MDIRTNEGHYLLAFLFIKFREPIKVWITTAFIKLKPFFVSQKFEFG